MSSGYAAYKQVQADTAGPVQLIIMLHEGAIRFLRQAEAGLAAHDYESASNGIIRAQMIIEELNVSLDRKRTAIAEPLDGLYAFMLGHLGDANMQKNRQILVEVVELLEELLGAWRGAQRAESQQKSIGRAA